MDKRHLIRLLAWLQKNKPNSNSGQIKFAPKLRIIRKDGWRYLELHLVNRSSWAVWVQEAAVVLVDLDAKWRAAVSNGRGRYEILQHVRPNGTLRVSLARTIYDAAGRPAGPYSCLISTNVRYRVFDEWCNAELDTYRVEMAALSACGLHGARRYDKRMKQIRGLD
jgi:hypothetical protein